jgi:hypothetical protein
VGTTNAPPVGFAGQTYTFATLPGGQVPNTQLYTSDVGNCVYNGYVWVPVASSLVPTLGLGDGISNLTAQNTQKLRAATARIRANKGTMKVAMVADSCFAGFDGAGVNSGYPGGRAFSVPVQLAAQLTSKGLPAQADNVFGNNNVGNAAAYTAYYPAVVTTNWSPTVVTSIPTLGAFGWQAGTLGANVAFTPVSAFDTIDIYTMNAPGNASFTVNVDGGATLATVSTASVAGYIKTTVTGVTLGTHTINLTTTSASACFLGGISVRASGTARVEVYNMGFDAVTAAIYATNVGPYNISQSLPVVAPDLTIIQLTINDIATNSGVATYTKALQTLITAALTTGDCVIAIGNPCGTANWSNGVSLGYQNAVYSLAATNNLPVIDITTRWISYAAANAVMPYYDTTFFLHPGAVGYADIAATHALLF